MRVAKVTVNLSLDKVFDYLIPDKLESQIKIGSQVIVPFGHSKRNGYVIAIAEKSAFKTLKEIEAIHDSQPEMPESLMSLGAWMAEYYCCSKEQATKALLPGAVRSGKIKTKKVASCYVPSVEKAQEFIFKKGKRCKAQAKILKLLLQEHELKVSRILQQLNVTAEPLRKLIKNNYVVKVERDSARNPFNTEVLPTSPLEPTEEQQQALKKIFEMMEDSGPPRVMLLHGVTGSGKTEVYLQAIAKTIAMNKEAIVLVPEISLTPQTVERFRSRFGDSICVLHSRLSDGERFDEWNRVYKKQVKIAVGARSALFAPFTNLGLIIVDEEHENSYKQEEAPRYNARDVAVMRAHKEGAAVILGTATPSLESYYNAQTGKYALSVLSKRIDDIKMPLMKVIDMSLEAAQTGKPQIFSRQLIEEINLRLENGEQCILFLNRRGFGRVMQCQHCGFIAECPECSVVFTYHRNRQCLSCHLCGAIVRAYQACPGCGAEDIRYQKPGTEKIESIAGSLFPHARVKRMDSDTMVRKNSYEKVLGDFRSGKIDILIGTQMIAKGLHFPRVTLVGIIAADISLFIPDFRSVERTFQLLTQVAGRAGRGDIEGEVMIQTYSPFNPAIQYAVEHDYEGFYEEELMVRNQLNYPPKADIIVVHFRGPDENVLNHYAGDLLKKLGPFLNPGITVSPPASAPIARIKGMFRYMIIFRGKPMNVLREHLRNLVLHEKHPKGVTVYVDVDALNIM